jgi:hypothetical protein
MFMNMNVFLLLLLAPFADALGSVLARSPAASARRTNPLPRASTVQDLVTAVAQVQSPQSKRVVEKLIDELAAQATQNPRALKQAPRVGAAYRTVWSTVTACTLPGQLKRETPAAVLGGDSWQVISADGKKAINMVYWPLLGKVGLRMIGFADLAPLPGKGQVGYALAIKGLEFRWGPRGLVPEVDDLCSKGGKADLGSRGDDQVWRLFLLKDGQTLDNGVGTLEILYNDGLVRVSRDNVQKNTYVHVREPLGDMPALAATFPRLP